LAKEFPGPSAAYANGGTDCGCSTGGRCPGSDTIWTSDPVWQALNFSIPDPFNYLPGYSGSGTGAGSIFTAFAKGDLNCNHTLATFTRTGSINANGDVTGSYQPVIVNELE
jgi:hypothetical protein